MMRKVRVYSQWVRNISSPSERPGEVSNSMLSGRCNIITGANSCYSAILGGHNNTIGAGFHNSFIIGSNVTAVANHMAHVENVNVNNMQAFLSNPPGTLEFITPTPALIAAGVPATACLVVIR